MGPDNVDYVNQKRIADYSIDPKSRQDESNVKSC